MGAAAAASAPIQPHFRQPLIYVSILLLSSLQLAPALPPPSASIAAARGPALGLVMAYPEESAALRNSDEFVPWPTLPFLDLYGRRFHIGSIRGVNVVYVQSGQRRLNAGITVQILLDIFDIRGIVHYGTAGSTNSSLSFGDVSVPKFVAFTGSWTWTKFNSGNKTLHDLSFGAYNIPNGGNNLLATVMFKTEELYSVGNPMEEVFWLQINSTWFGFAEKLNVELDRCVNQTFCLPRTPRVVFGLRGSTADVFVDNAAYREFLFREFAVSTVDEESSAVLMTAMSPGVPAVIFRGVSDLAGGEPQYSDTSLSRLAATNALKVALTFIELVGRAYSHLLTSEVSAASTREAVNQ